MNRPTLAALLLLIAPWLVPDAAHAGTNCRKFGTNGYFGNWHGMIDQSDPLLKKVVGLGGNLCGPAAAAHVLAGYDDHPNKPSTGDAVIAGYNDVDLNKFGSIIRKQGLLMGTNRTTIDIDLGLTDLEIKTKGTMAWNIAEPVKSSLANSFYSFGSDGGQGTLPTTYWSYYSGLIPSNFTVDTLAEPICADALASGKSNPGGPEYDYVKTQDLMSYGYFKIMQLNIPYPCGDWYALGLNEWCNAGTGLYSVEMTGGHFVSVVGGYDDGSKRYIGIANPHNQIYWSGVNQITIKIAGTITLFDRAGTVYAPNHTDRTKIVTSYTVTRVRHGGTCLYGTHLAMSGSSRGHCVR